MNREEQPAWLRATLGSLDEQAATLDAATLSRLNRMRQQALDQGLRGSRGRWRWPFAAFATACGVLLVIGMVSRLPTAGLVSPTTVMAPADYEMLVAGEDLELIEDLEFYAWLDQQSLDG